MNLKLDCKHFVGYKPCVYNNLCEECNHYTPMGTKVLIIKLGAMGDVLRTTPVLPALRKKYESVHITWLTNSESYDLLVSNPHIDRLMTYNLESTLQLQVERFDVLICLDKDVHAASLATLVKADEKFGFAFSEVGNIYPINSAAEYAFALGISDRLKFHENKQTYQEIIFRMLELDLPYGEYIFNLPEKDMQFASDILSKHGITNNHLVIGFNIGAGGGFAGKKWTIDGYVELAKKIHNELEGKVVLLGGFDEVDRCAQILKRADVPIVHSGNHNTVNQFAGLIAHCGAIISGDTLGMHLAIAMKTPVIALFGSTCPQEIDLYGRGKKIVSNVDCAPCYKQYCEHGELCMKKIDVEQVFTCLYSLVRNRTED